jgi:hypothetical protein
MKIQFFHQIGPMLFYGLDADTKIFGNPLVSITFGDQLQDLPLPMGDGIPGGWVLSFSPLSTPHHLSEIPG